MNGALGHTMAAITSAVLAIQVAISVPGVAEHRAFLYGVWLCGMAVGVDGLRHAQPRLVFQ